MQTTTSVLSPITSEQLTSVTGGVHDPDPPSPRSDGEIVGGAVAPRSGGEIVGAIVGGAVAPRSGGGIVGAVVGGAAIKALGNGPVCPAPRGRMIPF